MLQTLNCIRMGEVLLDENLHLFILCNNCHADLRNLQEFRQHLEKCDGLENMFQEGQLFKFNTDKSTQLFGKTVKGIKEFLIYDYNDVEVSYSNTDDSFIDMINIEEELLDPKWYSDLNTDANSKTTPTKTSKQYDELVEAVTPFVQFKENLKTNNNSCTNGKSTLTKSSTETKTIPKAERNSKCVQFDLTANKIKPAAKRKLSLASTEPIVIATTPVNTQNSNSVPPINRVCKTYASKKRKTIEVVTNGYVKPPEIKRVIISADPKSNNSTSYLPTLQSTTTGTTLPTNIILNTTACKTRAVPTTIIKQQPTKEKQTAQILNKLQNLGLQVKRTQPLPTPIASVNTTLAPNRTDTKTLEILQKLQSKGMKVKILNKQQPKETNNTLAKPLPVGIVPNPSQKPISNVIRNSTATVAIKQNLNKNLIIRKVN
ncbi:hypothetical protein DOY81_000806 [Sarcophaga bullata]|nr:hypothetical protein DOY81_000806 [Sarcophaga bullata]